MATMTTDDEEILQALLKLHFAQARHLAVWLNRSSYVIARRLRALGPSRIRRNGEEQEGLGLVDSLEPPWGPHAESVWFPAQKALDYAADKGWLLRRVKAPQEKSPSRLEHEIRLSDLVLALKALLPGFVFTRHYQQLFDRWSSCEEDRINPDLFFAFESKGAFPSFFVEVENSREHHYRGGVSERIRKMQAYGRYPLDRLEERLGIDDFYVLTLLPSKVEVDNFVAKLQAAGGILATRKFWAAEYAAIEHLGESALRTPVDEARRLCDA